MLHEYCTNSGPGRFGVPEMTQMDGLGFSLCAAPLDIIRSCISEYMGLEPQKGGVRQIGEWRFGVFWTRVCQIRGVSEQEGQTWSIFELTLLYISGSLL